MDLAQRNRGVIAASAALALAGCAGSVHLGPGPYAPDPGCGRVIQALPSRISELSEVSTTAQSTVAWGTAGAAVTLRCGVEPPPPTDDRCIGVMGGDGVQIDWINPEAGSDLEPETARVEGGAWAFITYGRTPAIEVVVPATVAMEPADVLVAIGSAVNLAPADRACVSFTDVTPSRGEDG